MRMTRHVLLALPMAAFVALACQRHERPSGRALSPAAMQLGSRRATPDSGVDSGASRGPGVRPGLNASVLIGATNPYTGRTDAIVTGRQLFTGMNCSGCHSGYAGGGMGPNLRDSVWIYGSSDADLYATIAEGRPNGMPAWGERLPGQQIWQIIAYLRTLGSDAEPVKPPTPTRTTVSHNSAAKAS
jgi:cytochrome c oxidase cbb3-type subunit III